jgi:hypothetical protein
MITNISFRVGEGIDFTINAFVSAGDTFTSKVYSTILQMNKTTTGINKLGTWQEVVREICSKHKLEPDFEEIKNTDFARMPPVNYVQTMSDFAFLRKIIKEDLGLDFQIVSENGKIKLKVMPFPSYFYLKKKSAKKKFILFKKVDFKTAFPILSFEISPQQLLFLPEVPIKQEDVIEGKEKQAVMQIKQEETSGKKQPVNPQTNQPISQPQPPQGRGSPTLTPITTKTEKNQSSIDDYIGFFNRDIPFIQITFTTTGVLDIRTGDVIEVDLGESVFAKSEKETKGTSLKPTENYFYITHLTHDISEGGIETTIEAIRYTGEPTLKYIEQR